MCVCAFLCVSTVRYLIFLKIRAFISFKAFSRSVTRLHKPPPQPQGVFTVWFLTSDEEQLQNYIFFSPFFTAFQIWSLREMKGKCTELSGKKPKHLNTWSTATMYFSSCLIEQFRTCMKIWDELPRTHTLKMYFQSAHILSYTILEREETLLLQLLHINLTVDAINQYYK